jgi:hypothetical protein
MKMIKTGIICLLILFTFSAKAQTVAKDSVTNQQLRNIEFFAKIFGSVRYFYPSKAALQINWDKFAVYGVRKVKNCKNDQELIQTANNLFLPLCSELKINVPVKEPFLIPQKSDKYKIWEHYGSGECPVGGIIGLYYKSKWPYHSKVKSLAKKDSIFFATESIDGNLYFSTPNASCESKKTDAFKQLKSSVDSISLDKIDFKSKKAFVTARDHDFQIASLITTWNNLRFFHPYSHINKIIWDALLQQTIEKTYHANNEVDFFIVFSQMLSSLNGGHVFTRLECTQKINFILIDQVFIHPWILPIEVLVRDTMATVVNGENPDIEILSKGSKIDSINGKSIADWISFQMGMMSGSKQRKCFDLQTFLFSSYVDTMFTITFTSPENIRQTVQMKGIRRWFWGIDKPKSPFLQEQSNGIYALNFGSPLASKKEMKKAIKILQRQKNLKGIIVDFRSVRYFTDELLAYLTNGKIESANWNVPVKSSPDRAKYFTENYFIKSKKKTFEVPIVFLTDASIISYGETVMQMVKHYKLGTIVGTNTAGCNGNATRFMTPVFNVWAYTGMYVENIDGSQLYNIGIVPDYFVENTAEDIIKGIDKQMNKAVELIKGKSIY